MDELHQPFPCRSRVLGVGVLAGLILHHGFFIHGEWHVHAPKIVLLHVFLFLCSSLAGIIHEYLYPGSRFFTDIVTFTISYCATLFLSITTYRLFFHRLTRAGFSGPLSARVTKLWHVWASRTSQNHLVLAELNRKYGDFVRTGPSEVTVFHPDVFSAIDGPKSNCIKSEWYDILHPNLSLVTARVKEIHQTRRRQWNRGFSANALVQYEKKTLKYLDQLDSCIEADAIAKRVTNVRDLLYWFGFDVMGDFVFNKSFGMLQNQEWHHIVILLQRALSLLGPFSPVPWLVQLGFKVLPRVSVLRDWFDMVAWCEKQMWERTKEPNDETREPDVAHYLMDDAKSNGFSKQSWMWLNGDSLLVIVAGSEPTASTLVGILCELARNPEHAEKIHREVKHVDINDVKLLSKLLHLEGVIAEALRLYPALPTGGNRKTIEQGIVIGGTYIPPHTTIVAPRFSISRSREDCFEQGQDFIPERWYQMPEMVRNKAAYTPFGTGHHSCLGRFLAMDNMRLVIARLIKRYRIRFLQGETGSRVTSDLRDQFTSNPGQLRLVFELRDS